MYLLNHPTTFILMDFQGYLWTFCGPFSSAFVGHFWSIPLKYFEMLTN